jgi:integrase
MITTTNTVEKITNFNKNKQLDLQDILRKYFEKKAESSKNTQKNYISTISEFFLSTIHKPLEKLTWTDLQYISAMDLELWRDSLRKRVSNRTINIKKTIMRSFMKEMRVYDPKIQEHIWNGSPESFKEHQKNSYGSLTDIEMKELIDYARQRKYQLKSLRSGKVATYIELLYITGLRAEALRGIKKSNISTKIDPYTGTFEKGIYIHDKTKERFVSLDEDIYNTLMNMCEDEERVFNFSDRITSKVLSEFCEIKGIDSRRNIKLHSIRKASGDHVLKSTDDIQKVAQHLGHSSSKTTLDWYTGRNNSIGQQASKNFYKHEKQDKDLESMSKEELIKILRKGTN